MSGHDEKRAQRVSNVACSSSFRLTRRLSDHLRPEKFYTRKPQSAACRPTGCRDPSHGERLKSSTAELEARLTRRDFHDNNHHSNRSRLSIHPNSTGPSVVPFPAMDRNVGRPLDGIKTDSQQLNKMEFKPSRVGTHQAPMRGSLEKLATLGRPATRSS